MKRSVTIAVAGVVTVASLSIGGIASAANKAVELTIDGQQQVVHVWGTTVQDVLDANGIQINDADELSPAANTPLSDGTEVTVKYVRPVTVITDGVSQTYWTTATTVQDALAEIGLHDPATRLSVDRSTPLGREGLTLTASTPKTVHLTVDGQTIDTVTTAADVKSLLNEAGIRLGSNDRVTPEQVQRVDVSEVNQTEKIDYQSVRTEDSTLAKGVTKVTTEGKAGEKKVIYQVTTVDGTEESRTALSEEVITQPVDEQVSVGTKATSYTGSHADWMSAAGIAESDWSDLGPARIQLESECGQRIEWRLRASAVTALLQARAQLDRPGRRAQVGRPVRERTLWRLAASAGAFILLWLVLTASSACGFRGD